ncbi:MAG: phospholipid carrier-dependent glycosyltransferase, partial [Christensenellales bacterium]
FPASSVKLEPRSRKLWFNELAFYDENGARIPASIGTVDGVSSYAHSSPAHLLDEQDRIPEVGSFMTDMYFDEIYHARTAFEHLNGLAPYENSHPPLGKIFIMLGVAVFGMNPLGWRIVGTLFGIGMVPLMYIFGKRLFKKPGYAFLGAFLFTFDFMHFAQTRIATIDSYSVFFIIAMLYFMYRFYTTTNYNTQSLKSCLPPLFLSGLMLGLGIASKWICVYAGLGVAVMLLIYLYKRYREYLYALEEYSTAQGAERMRLVGILTGYKKKTLGLFFLCLLFFIIIPLAIYLASYLPYRLVVEGQAYDLSGVWGVQEFMLTYHSGLTAGHPFSSQWWEWPLMFKPIWYYKGAVEAGKVAAISSFGNPAVWWAGFVAMLAVGYWAIKGRYKGDSGILLVFVGIAANFLPWIAVTRATFIYHYFATVPFMVFALVYFFKYIEERRPKLVRLRYAYMAVVLIFFILYYPLLSGMTVDIGYARFVRTIPAWTIFG